MIPYPEPRLLADIGATSARLCVESEPGQFEHVAVVRCDEYGSLTELLKTYLDTLPAPRPRHGAVAMPNPVEDDWVCMTNRAWAFSIREAQRELRLGTLLVTNDFVALARSLPSLPTEGRRQVGAGAAQPQGVIGLIGPGTGLGIAGLIPSNDRWVTLASEGGHASFAPNDERELRVLTYAWKKMARVSAERLLSGPGITLIHQALTSELPDADAEAHLDSAEIVRRALSGESPACIATLNCFCGVLGTVASDLALTLGATGGIYIGGGIVPRLGDFIERSSFRERFQAKGRFSDYVSRIPTYVLTAHNPAFHGLSSLLAEHLPDRGATHPLLERVRASLDALSPAERRVADFVVANPRAVLNDAVAVIARAAEVSQPTVIRFCRSLGFQGLADFKLKLGSGFGGTLPTQRSQVRPEDATPDLCAKVLDNTISAIVQFRESLNVDAVDEALGLLRGARRVEFYAMGNSAVVALDGQHKLFRFRIPSVAHTDPSMLALAAELLGPTDVAVFVSSSGQPPELSRAAANALDRGAKVIAITASQSPLARKSTVCIPVDHTEEANTFVAMISRILHLLVVDMLAVGVSVRRGELQLPEATQSSSHDGQHLPAPGMLVSHVA